MFYVRHHDDQVAVFNSRCQTVVLLNHMRRALNVPGPIDLLQQAAEYKNAAPVGLQDKGDTTYANTVLAPRASYVLLQTQEDEDGLREHTVVWRSPKSDEADRIAAVLEARLADERKKVGSGAKGKSKK